MDLTLNFIPLTQFFAQHPDVIMYQLMLYFGWMPLLFVIVQGFWEIWIMGRQDIYFATLEFVFLAIDLPKNNLQSPKAVENLFNMIGGAHSNPNDYEKYWLGTFQLGFSFEIVSIGGYTQYVIRTPKQFRDLVQAAVYSQYPDAEITEIEDYTQDSPKSFPDSEYDVWGSEFILTAPNPYPIKTYTNFEDTNAEKEMIYKDPTSTLMDICNSLHEGEQLWYQIIVNPMGMGELVEPAQKEIKKIMGEKTKAPDHLVDQFVKIIMQTLNDFGEVIYKLWGYDSAKTVEKETAPLKMMDLKPIEKLKVEKISEKASKQTFITKIRLVYLAKKELINKAKVANGFVGYLKQFADIHLNSFKPDKYSIVKGQYFLKHHTIRKRQNKIISRYKGRSMYQGGPTMVLNTEELATLWCFPNEQVIKAPLLQRVMGKKSQPPVSLPMDDIGNENREDLINKMGRDIDVFKDEIINLSKEREGEKKEEKKEIEQEKIQPKEPPANLPIK